MNFDEDLEESRSDKIYSSGNRGVKKGPGPRGTRNGEFLVSSLILAHVMITMVFIQNLVI